MSNPHSVNPHEPFYGGAAAYSSKTSEYFSGARHDYVAELPQNPMGKILEIGCSNGDTGALALLKNKCGFYCGVEMCEVAAEHARKKISEVIVGNIEELDLSLPSGSFDVLILSEVLEHLVDPWSTLRKLRPAMKPGSLVFASSPNVSNYHVITMLLRGDWALTEFGVMDKTHLRWFTPKTYKSLFEASGYSVDAVREHVPLTAKARVVNVLTGGRFKHLFMGQVDLRAHCS